MITDPRYRTQVDRAAHRPELNRIMADWAAQRTLQQCLDELGEEVPCSKVFNVADVMNDAHFKARNMFVDVVTEKFGTLTMQNVVPKMSGTPGRVNWAGSPLGAFNEEIYLGKLGLARQEYEQLQADGII
jgi:crotonobetainyl-CoA:carnitine CoA-transferase CaiB-like acyl-CoA transferase